MIWRCGFRGWQWRPYGYPEFRLEDWENTPSGFLTLTGCDRRRWHRGYHSSDGITLARNSYDAIPLDQLVRV